MATSFEDYVLTGLLLPRLVSLSCLEFPPWCLPVVQPDESWWLNCFQDLAYFTPFFFFSLCLRRLLSSVGAINCASAEIFRQFCISVT